MSIILYNDISKRKEIVSVKDPAENSRDIIVAVIRLISIKSD